jgi:hypothetical protein
MRSENRLRRVVLPETDRASGTIENVFSELPTAPKLSRFQIEQNNN